MLWWYNLGVNISRIDMVWALGKARNKEIIISHELGNYSFIVAQNNNTVIYNSAKFAEHAELESCLGEIISQYAMQKASCSVILRAGYSQLLIDKPMVPEKEMAAAVGWVSKDIVNDLPYKNPLVAHFYGAGEKMNLVVTEQDTVACYKAMLLRQGLRLGAMTIEELAVVKMLHKHSESCIAVYLSLYEDKTNSAIFVLDQQLLGVKKLPAVALDEIGKNSSLIELWRVLQQHVQHYLPGVKKDPGYKVLLAPASHNDSLAASFAEVFDTSIEVFDASASLEVKNNGLNLFKVLPKNTSAIPNANHILYSWLVALVCAIAIHVALLWQHNGLQTANQVIKNDLVAMFNKISNVASDVAGGDSKLAGVVRNSGLIKYVSAYDKFYELALIKSEQVWLTSINLDFEHSMFKMDGKAADSAAMYNMASAVKRSAAYKDAKLDLKNVNRSDDLYDFSLTNMNSRRVRR